MPSFEDYNMEGRTYRFTDENILYPFGYGLSYTDFTIEITQIWEQDEQLTMAVQVTNTGNYPGRDVLQCYLTAPYTGRVERSIVELVGFAKTGLLQPGDSEVLTIRVRDLDCASFDDSGITGYKDAFVLESGEFLFYVGNCSTTQVIGASVIA